jgi:HEAT repeat protein
MPEPYLTLKPSPVYLHEMAKRIQICIADLCDEAPLRRRMAALRLGMLHWHVRARHAVPALRAALADADPLVRLFAAESLALLGEPVGEVVSILTGFLRDAFADVRLRAAVALAYIGPAAVEALPHLVELIQHPNVELRLAAVQAIRTLRPPVSIAAPALFQALRDADDRVWRAAENALVDMGRDAVPLLIQSLGDQHLGYSIGRVLSRIAWVPQSSAEALVETFIDGRLWSPGLPVRFFDADPRLTALCWIESPEPVVEKMLAHPGAAVRRVAVDYLAKSKSLDARWIPGLQEASSDPDPEVRYGAVCALADMGQVLPAARAVAIPLLCAAVGDPALGRHRWYLVCLLGCLGGPEALAILRTAQTDPDKEVRREAAVAWRRLTGETGVDRTSSAAEDAREAARDASLLEDLKDHNPWVVRSAVDALWVRGHRSEEVTSLFLKQALGESLYDLKSRHVFGGMSFAALRANWPELLIRLKDHLGADPSLMAAVYQALDNGDDTACLNACRLIWELDQRVDLVLPQLITSLLRRSLHPTTAAAELLAALGPRAREAVPAATELLTDKYWLYRWYAVQILGSIGPAAVAAVPAVIDTFDDEYAEVREAAAVALGEIRPDVRETVPSLLTAVDVDSLRRAIVQSLRWLGPDGLQPFLKAFERRMTAERARQAK